jgi:hypothetical protein
VKSLVDIFGGSPLVAAFVVLLLSNVALFAMLQRSNREHLKTARMLEPMAINAAAALENFRATLDGSVKPLHEATIILNAMRRPAPRGKNAPGDTGSQGGSK